MGRLGCVPLGLCLLGASSCRGDGPRRTVPPATADASALIVDADAPDTSDVAVAPLLNPSDGGLPIGPPSPLDGIYEGPSEAYVVVLGGAVRLIRLRYTDNDGLMFVGARIESEGNWEIRNNAFTIATNAAVLRGAFRRAGRIDGTWEEGKFSGTWNATRGGTADAAVDRRSDAVVRRDAGRRDARRDLRGN